MFCVRPVCSNHSQWLDFPREGNNNSFQYARRQWNVVDDPLLRYRYLNEFDKAMNHAEEKYGWLHAEPAYVSLKHEVDKVIVFERAGLLFVFNFHPTQSFSDYRIGVEEVGDYEIVLSSDEKRFGGFENVLLGGTFKTTPMQWNERKNWTQVSGTQSARSKGSSSEGWALQVYIPSRTCIVLAKK